MKELEKFNKSTEVVNIIKKYSVATGWMPLRVMTGMDMVVLIDSKGAVIKVVDLRPWKLN